MRVKDKGFTVDYLLQKLRVVYCPRDSHFDVVMSPNSTKSLPLLLFKRGNKVQAIIVVHESSLDRNKLDSMRSPGSLVYAEMKCQDCRVVIVYTKKKYKGINSQDLAFNCMWVCDNEDYKLMSSDRLSCFLYPHNQYIYENRVRPFVDRGLLDAKPKRAGVVLPTGWGKTFLMSRIIFDNPDRKCLIICPTRLIRDQFKEVLAPLKDSVVVMTYQALLMQHNNVAEDEQIPEERLRDIDIALFDEIHHSLGEEFRKAVSHFLWHYNPKIAIGFTATPMGGKSRDQNSIDTHFEQLELAKVSFNDAWRYDLLPTPVVICPTSKRLEGEAEQTSFVKVNDVLPSNISGSRLKVADAGMSEITGCLRSGRIHHVLYFLEKWVESDAAEAFMRRALAEAGFDESEYCFWSLRGDEDSESEQRNTKQAYEEDPSGGVRVHVLFGAVMIKEGYHPKCKVDMAIIGSPIKSENMIIQMIGRTQFVQSHMVDKAQPYRPVIVDFWNTTSIFRKEEDYINLSGKSPILRDGVDRDPSNARGKKPVTVIGDTKMLDGDQALSHFSKERKLDWDSFKNCLEEFFQGTGHVPGDCSGYVDLVGRHSDPNKNFFYYYAQLLLNVQHEFHKPLVDWLQQHKQKETLRWMEPDFPNGMRLESLGDFLACGEPVVQRARFYQERVTQCVATLGTAMVNRIQTFSDWLCTLLYNKVFEGFKERYGVLPAVGMELSDARLGRVIACCDFLSILPKQFYMGTVEQKAFELGEVAYATDWHRVLRAVETGSSIGEPMGVFVNHLQGQPGKGLTEFLQGLDIPIDKRKEVAKELKLLARSVDMLLSSERQSARYYELLAAIYRKLYARHTLVSRYIQLFGNLLLEKEMTIRVVGCMAGDKENYAMCFLNNDQGRTKELITQYAESVDRFPEPSDRRKLLLRLNNEIAALLGRDPNAIEIDMFVKRLKNRQ